MVEPQLRHSIPVSRRSAARGPHAWVVVSCALALLAAQPVMGGEAPGAQPAVAWQHADVAAGVHAGAVAAPVKNKTDPGGAEMRGVQAERFTPRLHILATVAILQRLIMGELHPTHVPALHAFLWCEPACVGFETAPLGLGHPVARAPLPGGFTPAERTFAIGHQLLAPPRV